MYSVEDPYFEFGSPDGSPVGDNLISYSSYFTILNVRMTREISFFYFWDSSKEKPQLCFLITSKHFCGRVGPFHGISYQVKH